MITSTPSRSAAARSRAVGRPRRWSDAELLDAVRTAHASNPDQLTTLVYASLRAPGEPGLSTLIDRYGSWPRVLAAAGIPARPHARWTRDAAAEALAHWLRASASTRLRDYRSDRGPERPSEDTLRRIFGGWPAAVAAARAR